MSEAGFHELEQSLRGALDARDLDALARCDDRARALIAATIADAARDPRAHARLTRLSEIYGELIREVSEHRRALSRAAREQRARSRSIAAYRESSRADRSKWAP